MTAKYHAIAEKIEIDIRTGPMYPGDRLPTMSMLAEQNHCSQSTILRAVTYLKALGLIEGHQGKAMYVADSRGWL